MRASKYAIIGLGAIVLVGAYLPFVHVGASSVAFIDLPGAHIGEARIVDLHPAAIIVTFLMILFGILMGIWAHIRQGMARWQAFLAVMCFGAILLRVKAARDYLAADVSLEPGSGQYVLMVAAGGAVLFGLLGLFKPDRELS
mgnify:CR=1 FL=1|tara:strand:+ start:1741 stop:2166 length:426 start_codon:yes stop_codon:yes gene_type:complete